MIGEGDTGREEVMNGTWGRVSDELGYCAAGENMVEPKPLSHPSTGNGTDDGRRSPTPAPYWGVGWKK